MLTSLLQICQQVHERELTRLSLLGEALTDPLTGAIWAPVLLRFSRSANSFTSWVRDSRRRATGLGILKAQAEMHGLAFLEVPDGK